MERGQTAVEKLSKAVDQRLDPLPPPQSPVSNLFIEDNDEIGEEETKLLNKD